MYTEHYDNMTEREQLVTTAEGGGYTMTHDDFDSDWQTGDEPHGTLTFDLPTPPTEQELYEQEIETLANDAIHQVKDSLDNWDTLSATQKREAVKYLLICMLNLSRGQY